MKDKGEYKYAHYCNDKAIVDFLNCNNSKNIPDAKEIRLLAYLIYLCAESNLETIESKGQNYVYITDSLILKNLKFFKGTSRTLKNYLRKLEGFEFIKRLVLNNNRRYVWINSDLLSLWKNTESSMRPTLFLKRYKPHLWDQVIAEYEPLLKESFKDCIENFNDTYDLNGEKYKTNTIYKGLMNYCKRWYHNDLKERYSHKINLSKEGNQNTGMKRIT